MASNANTEPSRTVALGAGSYWAAEKFIVEDFQLRFPNSIESAQVGFMNPHHDGGTKTMVGQVSTNVTGYIEVLNVTLKDFTLMEELIKFFFMFHDATTQNCQGSDIGPQYASVIFCSDIFQNAIALRVRTELQAAVSEGKIPAYEQANVETAIVSYTYFYPSFENQEEEYIRNRPSEHPNNHFYFDDWSSIEAAREASGVLSESTTTEPEVSALLSESTTTPKSVAGVHHARSTSEPLDFTLPIKRRKTLWRRCSSFRMSKCRSTPLFRRSHPNRTAPLAADLMVEPVIGEESEDRTITTQEENELFTSVNDLNIEALEAPRTIKNRLSASVILGKKGKKKTKRRGGRHKRTKISLKVKSSFEKLLSGIQRQEEPVINTTSEINSIAARSG